VLFNRWFKKHSRFHIILQGSASAGIEIIIFYEQVLIDSKTLKAVPQTDLHFASLRVQGKFKIGAGLDRKKQENKHKTCFIL
jgi:hypothetical protein